MSDEDYRLPLEAIADGLANDRVPGSGGLVTLVQVAGEGVLVLREIAETLERAARLLAAIRSELEVIANDVERRPR